MALEGALYSAVLFYDGDGVSQLLESVFAVFLIFRLVNLFSAPAQLTGNRLVSPFPFRSLSLCVSVSVSVRGGVYAAFHVMCFTRVATHSPRVPAASPPSF